ncbi:hypothetical protein LCGC14_0442240 [marine sediment metagenome]|uniref:Uncharacterized protein n=1 Tax=marine sediment metagenome TaxID=412755 RepID=A0A0F9SR52_9ZZZZ
METSSILLWGAGVIVAVIVLGMLLSKKNSSKKSEEPTPIEVPEKEYSQYNEDVVSDLEGDKKICLDEPEEEMWSKGKTILCSRCGRVEATDNYEDKPVCKDCFEELDENGEYYDFDEGDVSSGSCFNITDLVIGIVVLGIILTIGITILSTLSKSFSSGAFNTTEVSAINSTISGLESFSSFGDWFSIIIIVGVAAMILAIVFQAFGGMRGYDF